MKTQMKTLYTIVIEVKGEESDDTSELDIAMMGLDSDALDVVKDALCAFPRLRFESDVTC